MPIHPLGPHLLGSFITLLMKIQEKCDNIRRERASRQRILILHKIHVVINTFSASIWSEIKIEEEDAAKQVIIVFILRVIRITDRVRELSLDILDQ